MSGGGSLCPSGSGFPCDTEIVCVWFAFHATGSGGPDGDGFDIITDGGAVEVHSNGGGALLDVGSLEIDTHGGGWTVDTAGGGLIWDTGGGGWDLDTGGGGLSWDLHGGGGSFTGNAFDFDTPHAELSVGNGIFVTLGAGKKVSVVDSANNPIFEVREDGSVHILTGTAVIADL